MKEGVRFCVCRFDLERSVSRVHRLERQLAEALEQTTTPPTNTMATAVQGTPTATQPIPVEKTANEEVRHFQCIFSYVPSAFTEYCPRQTYFVSLYSLSIVERLGLWVCRESSFSFCLAVSTFSMIGIPVVS